MVCALQPEIELRRNSVYAEHFGSACWRTYPSSHEQVVTKSSPSKSANSCKAVRRKLNTVFTMEWFLLPTSADASTGFSEVFPGTVL